ncbi:hypothetical protein ABZ369_06570 [Streptomyces sp. NPDC005918]|uniref:hypothetical protein n=1 Tax=Streptomyces sp. NPDC005918 TaxID=3155454 RepID=UPI0033FCB9F5
MLLSLAAFWSVTIAWLLGVFVHSTRCQRGARHAARPDEVTREVAHLDLLTCREIWPDAPTDVRKDGPA